MKYLASNHPSLSSIECCCLRFVASVHFAAASAAPGIRLHIFLIDLLLTIIKEFTRSPFCPVHLLSLRTCMAVVRRCFCFRCYSWILALFGPPRPPLFWLRFVDPLMPQLISFVPLLMAFFVLSCWVLISCDISLNSLMDWLCWLLWTWYWYYLWNPVFLSFLFSYLRILASCTLESQIVSPVNWIWIPLWVRNKNWIKS